MVMLTFSALELIDHQENAEGTPIRDLATRFSQRARKHEPGTLRDPWLGVVVQKFLPLSETKFEIL
jgi:hypothetical protein